MKFNEGVWTARENIFVTNAVEVDQVWSSNDDTASSIRNTPGCEPFIRAICASRHIKHRGDLINKPTITVNITSPAPGIICIESSHFNGRSPLHEPRPSLFPGGKPTSNEPPIVHLDGTSATLKTGSGLASAVLNLEKDDFRIDITNADGEIVTNFGKESIQWILNTAATAGLASKENAVQTIYDPYHRAPSTWRQSYMSLAASLEPGEKVYGLGERFGPFIKNGQTIESSNDDGGATTDSAYKAIPFYLTNRNYGVFVDHFDHISYEVQSDRMTKVQMSVPGETIRAYIMVGSNPKEVLSLYTSLTGRPPLPPQWSYGLWLSTSFLTSYDEATVMTTVDKMHKLDIPLNVFHFDPFWMRPHTWCDFQFDPAAFPDPRGFISRLHDKGIKVCVWINPWVGQASRLFPEGDEKGYFVKRSDGRTLQSDAWQPGFAIVDFTNPAATKWWQSFLAELLDIGVDCFKTDFGERIQTEGVVYHDGSNPRTMHNAYALLYNKAVWDVVCENRGKDEACLFARSATTGTQRFPVHWGGDVDSKFTGLAETIRAGLSLGLSGFGYHSSDIGGFKSEGKVGGDSNSLPQGDLYKRWCQFGLLSSHSRLHGSGTHRVPWLIDDEAVSVLSKFVKLKGTLEPYLTTISIDDAVGQGHPLMRPLFLEYPKDPNTWHLDQQYMLGPSLLVAPVFGKSRVQYYVPKGSWTNLLTGKSSVGPTWEVEDHDMFTLPLLLRPETILVLGRDGHSVTDCVDQRGLKVVISRSQTSSISTQFTLRSGSTVKITVEPIFEASKLCGFKADVVGTTGEIELVVIGEGQGLDHPNCPFASAKGSSCVVEL